MTLKEIQNILQAEVLIGEDQLDVEIKNAGGCDLMSDVLAWGKPGILLLTGLSNSQSVRFLITGSLKRLILFKNSFFPLKGKLLTHFRRGTKRTNLYATQLIQLLTCAQIPHIAYMSWCIWQ